MDFQNAKLIVSEALARGYCHEPNEDKILDPELIEAMTTEVVIALIEARVVSQ